MEEQLNNDKVELMLDSKKRKVEEDEEKKEEMQNSFCFSKEPTLEKIRQMQAKFADDRNWNQFHSPRNLLLALVGEVGELAEVFQWKGEVKQGLPGWNEREKEHLGEELSDVLIYLVRLADKCNIDLPSAAIRKFGLNAQKYPATLVSGCSKKYTEYKQVDGGLSTEVKDYKEKHQVNDEICKIFRDAGIKSVLDFLNYNKEELVKNFLIHKEEIQKIEQVIFAEYATLPTNGTDLYEETLRLTKILSTGLLWLRLNSHEETNQLQDSLHRTVVVRNELTDGGLFTGEMIEFFGPPASGKTQIALYTTSNVIVNHELNVLYIDTTSSFISERLVQMIESHLDNMSPQLMKVILSRVNCLRLFNAFDLITELEQLKEKLATEVDAFCLHLKLIVVDSVASVITPILGGQQQHGHALMSKIGLLLKEIAYEYGIAVLVINNAVANYGESSVNGDLYKPSLGKSWLHIPHIRIFVDLSGKENAERIATIYKHCRMREKLSTTFYIKSGGLVSIATTLPE